MDKTRYHSALPAILFYYRVIEPLNKVRQEQLRRWKRRQNVWQYKQVKSKM